MNPRLLRFNDFTELMAEVDRLHQTGYARLGRWDLSQICDHLTYFIKGSLDGHPFRVPWIFKALFGRLVLHRILKQQRIKPGVPTPQKPLPAAGGDERTAVARFKEVVVRFESHQGELHASPFFGYLTPQQWRTVHLIHCGHHLGFLVPRDGPK